MFLLRQPAVSPCELRSGMIQFRAFRASARLSVRGTGCRANRAAAVSKTRSLRSNTQQKQGFWERRRIYFVEAWEEIRPDGEFLDKN